MSNDTRAIAGAQMRRALQVWSLEVDTSAEWAHTLAGRAGVSKASVYGIRAGTRDRPRLSTVARIARAMGIPVEWCLAENRGAPPFSQGAPEPEPAQVPIPSSGQNPNSMATGAKLVEVHSSASPEVDVMLALAELPPDARLRVIDWAVGRFVGQR